MANRERPPHVDYEQLKSLVRIGAVLARYGIELVRRGATLKGCCPFNAAAIPGSSPAQTACGGASATAIAAAASSSSSRHWSRSRNRMLFV